MARAIGPLLSLDARGTLAGMLTYRGDRRGVHVLKKISGTDRRTPKQLAQRAMLAFLGAEWGKLTRSEQATWEDEPTNPDGTSGIANFSAANLKIWQQYKSPFRERPMTAAGTAPPATPIPTAIGGKGQIMYAWLFFVPGSHWGIEIARRLGTVDPPMTSSIDTVAIRRSDYPAGTIWTELQVPAGTYRVRMRQFNGSGVQGSRSASQTVVVT